MDDGVDDRNRVFGEIRLSREKARKISTWKMLEDALESGEFVTGKIHNRVKGGFSVEVEVVKAFLPGSLVDVRPVKEAPDIENTVQEFKVIILGGGRVGKSSLLQRFCLGEFNEHNITTRAKASYPKTLEVNANFNEALAE